ncbi:MAG: energy-coupling factor ABC transporter ATP-binding protein [Candidatus Hodarchaeota archaeon]
MESVNKLRELNSLELRNLTISFSNSSPVIKGCNLKFSQGKTYLLTGTTASGKSTLLRFIKGLIPLFYSASIFGEILVNGKFFTLEEFWEYRNEIGYLFQDPPLQVIGSSVERDIAFGLENLAIPPLEMMSIIERIAHRLNIKHLLHRNPDELSGGELALIALASILVLQPKILLLDEFTAFLDNASRKKVFKTIKEIQNPNQIIIIVSHYLKEALPLVDEVIVLDKGQVLLQAPKAYFIASHYSTIKGKLRIPELFHLGINLCKNKGIDPIFDDVEGLYQLIGRENYD